MVCKNCNISLKETDDFCNKCGAKVIRNRLTIRNLFEHFSETFFNYDNKFLLTFIHLFTKPEAVIVGYIDGIRKKYINPISFLAISLTISGIYFFFFKEKFSDIMKTSSMVNSFVGQQKLTEAITNFTTDYNSLIYFVLIPFIAIVSLLIFNNKKYNFTEHIIVYLYSMSLASIVTVILTVLILIISPDNYLGFSTITYAFIFVYHGYILKRIFQLSAKELLIKTMIFIPLFLISYLMISFAIGIIVFFTGDFSLSDFAPKKA